MDSGMRKSAFVFSLYIGDEEKGFIIRSDLQGNLQIKIHPFRSPTPSITVKFRSSRKGEILKTHFG